jgi:hypothetical protein
MQFFDDKQTGKISVVEVVKAIQDITAQQQGGGLYAFMQAQPILQKVINELAIDCDKFFDEVADLNEAIIQDEIQTDAKNRISKNHGVGLSKKLLFSHLQKYGVDLDEDEKTLLSTVFGMPSSPDKFDYEKLDAAFEGVQSHLYNQGKCARLTLLYRATVHHRVAATHLQKDRRVPPEAQRDNLEVLQPD